MFPMVTDANKQHFKSLLAEYDVAVTNIEFFQLLENSDVAGFEPALALGAELGARLAVTHIHDPERDRALQSFSRLAELAGQYGISLGLEFMGLTPGCRSLQEALWFVRQCSCDNTGVGIDALHLYLTGGEAAELLDVDPQDIAYAQLCDTRAARESTVIDEARYIELAFARNAPGDGVIDLQGFIRNLPANTWFDIEVPYPGRVQAGVSAQDYAARIVDATRATLKTAIRYY